MNQTDLVIRGRRVVTENAIGPASAHISQGRIVGIAGFEEIPAGGAIVEAGEDSIVMPGLVDTHVHVNEPGRARWEGFETATKAAAAGGITTIVDMPLNSIPATTTLNALESKLEATRGKLHRSEEHTSELQSRLHLVCRLLLEKKNILVCFFPDANRAASRRIDSP